MRHFRFTLSSLLIAILFAGFGFAALKEANDTWDSSVFGNSLGMLLISILFAVHRTKKRRAFWLGFPLFGSAYLGFSLLPSIESRLITTKALNYLDSKAPRSSPDGLTYFDYDNDGLMDLVVANNSQPNVLSLNKGNGTWQDVRAIAGLNPAGNQAWSPWKGLLGTSLNGSNGTTEHFMRIGHSLLAMIVGSLGGYISRRLSVNNQETVEESVIPQRSTSSDRSGN